MQQDRRPNPDQLLRAIETASRSRHRGQLKIFFGSSAGVGKTYAMLQAAHILKNQNIDVIAGVIETHGRTETQKLLENLPSLPRKVYQHKDVKLGEFDLDLALTRKPTVILVDELAHTNAPGSRHPKRWQDIEELLEAGIDVYTTLNVQHLESSTDAVAGITGVIVFETVPDSFFDTADEVQLVDVPTEELLERLHQGKIYIADGAKERAAQNFFNKTNLMSLRELALRRTADHVDADTDLERIQEGLFTANLAGDRVLVCIGSDALGHKLVRTSRRIAASLKAPLFALAIDKPANFGSEKGQRQQRALQMAEQSGAKVTTLQEERIGDAILNYARTNGITKIVVGKTIRSAWIDWLFGSLVEYLIRNSGNIDIYIITGHGKKIVDKKPLVSLAILPYVFALCLAGLCTGIGVLLDPVLEPIDIVPIYLAGVLTTSIKFGRYPSLLYSLLSASCLNFFFIPPLYSFEMLTSSYWLTLAIMLITSFVISEQAGRLRKQTLMSRRREFETQTFFSLTKDLTAIRKRADIIKSALGHLTDALGTTALVWLHDNDEFSIIGGEVIGDKLKEEMVAKWAFDHKQPAGIGTNTMPSATGFYYPLQGSTENFGLLSIYPKSEIGLSIDQKITIETFSRLLTSSLERVSATQTAEQMHIDRESEKLKNTFLSSMSHDLRSPLSAISGSADTLLNGWRELDDVSRQNLLSSIHGESERLSRVVNNLLDLTRLETGRILVNQQPYYVPELIGATVEHMKNVLSHFPLIMEVEGNLPMVNVDGLLIEQLLQNLLENAAHFSKSGQRIVIKANRTIEGLIISVSDEGMGIEVGKETQIFDKFFTLSKKDRPKGAGLGLAICQAIVSIHNGRIWASNKSEGGAIIAFMLPKELFLQAMDIESVDTH